jgi:hypothetical protein
MICLRLILSFSLAVLPCVVHSQAPTQVPGTVQPTVPPAPVPAAPEPNAPIQESLLPTVHVRQATGPIDIDGKLTEPDWAKAEPMLLTQQQPHPGQPTPFTTEVRVLIEHDALVFGFHCIDPNPRSIQVHTLQYDAEADDDTVSVLLDTFGDRRTGYYFQINAAAARLDGLISGPGDLSINWDGIWTAKTAKTADGWSAEIWIPAQTLNFAGGSTHWGLQLDRSVVRNQTELRWASPILNADLYDFSRAGAMVLDAPLKQGLGLEFAPYVNGTMIRDFPTVDRNWTARTGGELTWRITPQLAAILSINTDFAETEVDSRQIDITPWPLYFPEKRAFFLEGSNLFNFGLGLDGLTNLQLPISFIPFFSRNVGLLDGYDIPLDGGFKLNGHVGPWSLAFLDAKTRTAYVPSFVVNDLGLSSSKVEGTNLLASRVAYDVDKHLRIGGIVTHGDPEAQVSNTLAGADAVWNTPKFLGNHTLQLGAWGATTQGDVPDGNREAWGLRVAYPSDLFNCTAGTNRFGQGFDPLLAYLPRPQTHQTDALCQFRPRPSPNGPYRAIRQALSSIGYSRYTDDQGNLQSQLFTIRPFAVTFTSGDTINVTAYVDHEVLTAPFAIVPSVSYPVGSYTFQRYGVDVSSSPQRALVFSNSSYVGGYYSGHLYDQINSLGWTALHGRVEATGTAQEYFAHTPQGNFVEKLWQFKGALSWSPDLSLSTFVQYDNVSFDLSANTRLRWTFRPGDDFYVIWDRTWERNVTHPGVNLEPNAESVTAKIQWTFRPRR